MGFVWTFLSTLTWALFQTLYGMFAQNDELKGAERSFLYLGAFESTQWIGYLLSADPWHPPRSEGLAHHVAAVAGHHHLALCRCRAL